MCHFPNSKLQKNKMYRVTIPLVQNLLLTSKQKFRFGLARTGQSGTFVLKSTGGFEQVEWSPCSYNHRTFWGLRELQIINSLQWCGQAWFSVALKSISFAQARSSVKKGMLLGATFLTASHFCLQGANRAANAPFVHCVKGLLQQKPTLGKSRWCLANEYHYRVTIPLVQTSRWLQKRSSVLA